MFLVNWINRNPSNGKESSYKRIFDTLEEAAEYIRTEWYDCFCETNDYPSDWYEDHLGGPMPTQEDFSLEAIQKIRSGKFKKMLFGPYNTYHCIVENELHLEEVGVSK